jgi:hypothetical protein
LASSRGERGGTMAITIQLPDGQRREFKHDPIVIGRGPGCQIRLTEESQLRDEHARIRKLAGRWLIESLGDWPIQAGEDASSRLSWLKVGDTIRLAQDGPELIFEPAHEDVMLDSAATGAASTRTDPSGPFSGPSSGRGCLSPMPEGPLRRAVPPPLPRSAGISDPVWSPRPAQVPGSRTTPPPLPGQRRANGSTPPPLPRPKPSITRVLNCA